MSALSVGVCNAAGGRASKPPGVWAVGGRHCTAGHWGPVD